MSLYRIECSKKLKNMKEIEEHSDERIWKIVLHSGETVKEGLTMEQALAFNLEKFITDSRNKNTIKKRLWVFGGSDE